MKLITKIIESYLNLWNKNQTKLYYERLMQFQGDAKKSRLIMNEKIGKARKTQFLLFHK